MTLSPNGSPVFLELGQRPDEAGPPISGESLYPADVTARLEASAKDIIAKYPRSRSALLPLLHLVQSEDGYLTKAGLSFCAGQLDLTEAEVTAVATFYSMYRRTPTGEYLVGVCTNTLCAIMGGDAILDYLQEHLGVHAGETTSRTVGSPSNTSSATPHATTRPSSWSTGSSSTTKPPPPQGIWSIHCGRARKSCPAAARRCARSRRPPESSPGCPTTARSP